MNYRFLEVGETVQASAGDEGVLCFGNDWYKIRPDGDVNGFKVTETEHGWFRRPLTEAEKAERQSKIIKGSETMRKLIDEADTLKARIVELEKQPATTEPPDTAFIEELLRHDKVQCETIQALGKAFIEVLKRTPGSVEHAMKTIAESEGRGGPDVDDRVKELEKELATTGDYYNAAVKRANKAEAELAAKSREFESWRSRALKAETDLAVVRSSTPPRSFDRAQKIKDHMGAIMEIWWEAFPNDPRPSGVSDNEVRLDAQVKKFKVVRSVLDFIPGPHQTLKDDDEVTVILKAHELRTLTSYRDEK